jgi:hypothetical protein
MKGKNMEINFKQDTSTASVTDKENIKTALGEDLLKGYPIVPPKDETINVFLYSDNIATFKISGTVKDSNNQFLFTFSYFDGSITSYDWSLPSMVTDGK